MTSKGGAGLQFDIRAREHFTRTLFTGDTLITATYHREPPSCRDVPGASHSKGTKNVLVFEKWPPDAIEPYNMT